jgi:DNA-binding NarL/FixJ family response regulator
MISKSKIVICEDHPIYAKGMEDFLKQHFEVCEVFDNGKSTINYLSKYQVDILLLDLNMEEMNGVEVVEKLKSINNTVKIVIVSMYNDKMLIEKCKKLGVNAYCSKQIANSELLIILDSLKHNELIVDSSLKERIRDTNSNKKKEDFEKKYLLTKREKELITLFSEGLTNKEIASKLSVSSFTIDTHKKNIFRKLKIKNTVELVKFYYENF